MSKLNYSFVHKFPSLARDWSIAQYYAAVRPATRDIPVATVLMELDKEKGGDLYALSIEEARLYQSVADRCDGAIGGAVDVSSTDSKSERARWPQVEKCKVPGFVVSAPVAAGPAVMQKFLDELGTVAPRARGIRESILAVPESYYLNETYIQALRKVAQRGLVFELLMNADQLPGVTRLADALPELAINVDHLAYPNLTGAPGRVDAPWVEHIRALSRRRNVFAKLSGLPQAFGRDGWSASDFQPYVDVAVEAFGPSRINFAGNWFILNRFGNYSSMLDAVTTCLSRVRPALSQWDVDTIFAGTAASLYKLDDADRVQASAAAIWYV